MTNGKYNIQRLSFLATILTIMLNNTSFAAELKSQPKFHAAQEVKFKDPFYSGCTGRIFNYTKWDNGYSYVVYKIKCVLDHGEGWVYFDDGIYVNEEDLI